MNAIFNIVKSGMLCCVLSFCFLIPGVRADQSDKVIATVNGTPIHYKDIRVSAEGGLNGKLSASDIIHREKSILGKIIRIKTLDGLFKKFNIKVSKEEVRGKLDRHFEELGVDEDRAEEIRIKLLKLVKALEKWHAQPEKGDEIYQSDLASVTTYQDWKFQQQTYDTLAKVEKMIDFIPDSLEDMKKVTESGIMREMLLERLKKRVVKDVSVSDEDVRELYRIKNIKSWEVLHFFSKDRNALVKAKKEVSAGRKSDVDSVTEYLFFRVPAPFYAAEVFNLGVDEVSKITAGPLSLSSSTKRTRERFSDDIANGVNHFHFILLVNEKMVKKIPSFSSVKDTLKEELTVKRREEHFKEWFSEELGKADIKIVSPMHK